MLDSSFEEDYLSTVLQTERPLLGSSSGENSVLQVNKDLLLPLASYNDRIKDLQNVIKGLQDEIKLLKLHNVQIAEVDNDVDKVCSLYFSLLLFACPE